MPAGLLRTLSAMCHIQLLTPVLAKVLISQSSDVLNNTDSY